jgi:TerC family integral membrane protein
MLPWLALTALVAVALAIDLRVAGRGPYSTRSAIFWSIVWTALGLAFAGVVTIVIGSQAGGEYLAGFLIEKSLSLDNLFVFAVLFSFFGVPAGQRHRVLLYGIGGAIVLRAIFIVAGVAALDVFSGTTYILGALLAATAVRVGVQRGDIVQPERTLAMRLLRRTVPLSPHQDGAHMTIVEAGKRLATPLLAALLAIAVFDVMFAIDSIPAIFAITRDTFVVFAANAFSLLGMVSLYFVLEGLLKRFRYLHIGLATILGYVAVKMLLNEVWHPPVAVSLGVIVLSLALAAAASMLADRRDRRAGARDPAATDSA